MSRQRRPERKAKPIWVCVIRVASVLSLGVWLGASLPMLQRPCVWVASQRRAVDWTELKLNETKKKTDRGVAEGENMCWEILRKEPITRNWCFGVFFLGNYEVGWHKFLDAVLTFIRCYCLNIKVNIIKNKKKIWQNTQ